ncbi:prepilin peptidase [Lysinibacillus sp. BW-2-10]|uniref:A24 family peptidase n=1 Tax=Lysinibacillus sp. BW-2-10 TaxID=2590030 RepID=UPI00117F6A15|nr:prepilin peptidase [Lysinibacillus sp. BW-2-10]TSI02285.1 prepilin peptidase [Lysinibacillus sp. BW-2-10]
MVEIVLLFVLLFCLITDIYNRKILNVVTIPAILFGLIYFTTESGLEGLWFSFSGFIFGLILLLIPFMFGGMGAGDVKLMAAIGALMGSIFVLHAFFFTAIIGGCISLIILLRRMGIKQVATHMFVTFFVFRGQTKEMYTSPEGKRNFSFPYGVAIVSGTLLAYIWGGYL